MYSLCRCVKPEQKMAIPRRVLQKEIKSVEQRAEQDIKRLTEKLKKAEVGSLSLSYVPMNVYDVDPSICKALVILKFYLIIILVNNNGNSLLWFLLEHVMFILTLCKLIFLSILNCRKSQTKTNLLLPLLHHHSQALCLASHH